MKGRKALAPAEFFANKSNIENPELYPVFPFRLFAFNRPNADWALAALEHRWDRGHSGWRQDDIFMAYLGLADDARKAVVSRARSHDRGERFPAFWGPNYDWTPDQDHGGVLMKAFQVHAAADRRAADLPPARLAEGMGRASSNSTRRSRRLCRRGLSRRQNGVVARDAGIAPARTW